jgi:hypothetical protein
MSKVAILGCGPAGLLCAHAVEQMGHEPVIFSRKEKSHIPGSLYFKEPIPGLTAVYPESTVLHVRIGPREGYAEKVYNDAERQTGWDHYKDSLYPAWNVPAAYDVLWDRYEDAIIDSPSIGQVTLTMILDMNELTISTLPQPSICMQGHSFEGTPYWIQELDCAPEDASRDIVVYNGFADDPWYRWTILGGKQSIEFAAPPLYGSSAGLIAGRKAVSNDCDCWPNLVRAGRWAEWRHGVLLQDAYKKAMQEVGRIS